VPRLPPLVEAFLKQCLRKAPRDRVHAIADVRLALAGAYDVDREVDAPADAPSPGWRRLVWPAAVVVAALAAFAGARYLPSGTTPGTSASVRQLTFQQGNVGAARFTSDGQGIVYGASWDGAPYRVFTTRLDGTQSRAIDGLPDADLLDVSSRNRLALSTGRPPVDGFLPRGKLAEVDLTGGAPRERLDDVVAADWGPDGELAAVVRRTDEGSWLEFPVGTVVHRALVITSPRVSPDGRHVCFAESYGYLYTAGPGETPEMLVPTVLPRLARCAWSAGGDDILFSYSPTGATHVSIEAVGVNGDNRRVLVSSTAYLTLEDVSANGDVLVTSGTFQYSVRGFAGDRERDLSVFEASSVVHLGAAGRRLLLFDNTAGVQAERLSLRPLDGSPAVGLGALLDGLVLALTSDGERYAFLENEASGGMSTIRLVPTGAGESSTVRLPVVIDQVYRNGFATTDPDVRTADFSDDNRRLLLPSATGEGDRAPRIYVHDFTSERTLPVTPEGVTGPAALSPDGRFVASSEPDGLFVYDVDTGDRRAVPGGPEPGVPARWSATGDVLYLFEQEGAVVTIVARDLRTGARQATREIRVPDPAGVIHLEPWIARSGDAYAYSLGRIRTNVFVIDALVRGAD
jgi:Tol biopolymer transport system component